MKKIMTFGSIVVITAITFTLVDVAVRRYARDHGWA